jgi:hypothetical protein
VISAIRRSAAIAALAFTLTVILSAMAERPLAAAAASSPSVRFVLFCATDKCNGSISKIDYRARQVRNWYERKLDTGGTFRLLKTKKFIGAHSAAYYDNGTGDAANNTWNNLWNEPGLQEDNVKTVAILGFHSMNHCGIGAGWLGVVDPYQGCTGNQNAVYAHELGHTLGLDHTSDGTLMTAPYACNGATLAHCKLNSSQRTYLINNKAKWFPVITLSAFDPDVVADDTSFLDAVPLWEYWNGTSKDHFYTTTRNDPGLAWFGYSLSGNPAWVLPESASGTLPLKRYYSASNHHHFYSVHPETACFGVLDISACGYAYEGIEGYVYTSQPGYTAAFRDYAQSSTLDHVYTTTWTTWCWSYDISACGYSYFAGAGYVYPTDPS